MAPSPSIADLTSLSLAEIARIASEQPHAPVEAWNPDHCGDSEIRIAPDGSWFHQGSRITRPELVRLLSSVLRREEEGSYVLVTPAEKLSIMVDDLPFFASEMKTEGYGPQRSIAFRLNTGDLVLADADHPLSFGADAESPRPAILVRTGLSARIARPVYYELAALAIEEGMKPPSLWSGGCAFPLSVGP